MANTLLSLFNQAVSQAGGQAEIADPEENTREANLCNLWYSVVRDNVQQTAPWPSTKANNRLALLGERDTSEDWVETDPGPGFLFAYAAPSDMLRPRFLHSYVPFDRQRFNGQIAIMTNQETPILQYTRREEDISKWDTELYHTTIFSLAAHITLPLSEKISLRNLLQGLAVQAILLAINEVANEQHDRQQEMPTMLAVRDYQVPPVASTFSYPFAKLNAVPA